MDPRVQRFVIQAFNSVPLATQWLECCFASVKQWLHTSLRPLSGATLAAKYVTHHMDTLWKAERDASNAPDTIFDSIEATEVEEQAAAADTRPAKVKKPKKTPRGRPLWTKRSRRLNGYHMACKCFLRKRKGASLVDACGQYREVAAGEKDAFAREARLRNAHERILFAEECKREIEQYREQEEQEQQGPWGLGDGAFPYGLKRVWRDGYDPLDSKSVSVIKAHAAQWEAAGCRVPPHPDPPATSTEDRACCSKDLPVCRDKLEGEMGIQYRFLANAIQCCVLTQIMNKVEPCVLQLAGPEERAVYFECIDVSSKKESNFVADFLLYTMEIYGGVRRLRVPDVDLPHIHSHQDLAWLCTKKALGLWTLSVIRVARWKDERRSGFEALAVTSIDAFDLDAAQAQLIANAECKTALKLFREMTSGTAPARRKKKKPPSRCKRPAPRLTLRAKQFGVQILTPVPPKVVDHSDTPSSSSSGSASESSSEDWKEFKELAARKTKAAQKNYNQKAKANKIIDGIDVDSRFVMDELGRVWDGADLLGKIHRPLDEQLMQVVCCKHSGCSRWIEMTLSMGIGSLVRWLGDWALYGDSRAHLGALTTGQVYRVARPEPVEPRVARPEPVKPVQEPPVPEACNRRPKGRGKGRYINDGHSYRWGPFTISMVFDSGVWVGMGCSCKWHHNMTDTAANICQTSLKFITNEEIIQEEEAVLRLKRWLVEGLDIDPHGPLRWKARTDHVKIKARTLRDGLDERALDDRVRDLVLR